MLAVAGRASGVRAAAARVRRPLGAQGGGLSVHRRAPAPRLLQLERALWRVAGLRPEPEGTCWRELPPPRRRRPRTGPLGVVGRGRARLPVGTATALCDEVLAAPWEAKEGVVLHGGVVACGGAAFAGCAQWSTSAGGGGGGRGRRCSVAGTRVRAPRRVAPGRTARGCVTEPLPARVRSCGLSEGSWAPHTPPGRLLRRDPPLPAFSPTTLCPCSAGKGRHDEEENEEAEAGRSETERGCLSDRSSHGGRSVHSSGRRVAASASARPGLTGRARCGRLRPARRPAAGGARQ